MALTVTEANAVFDLLHWLGWDPGWGRGNEPVSDERAAEAVALLGEHAGQKLQITVRPDDAAAGVRRMAGRLAGAESDGHAQAVCRAIEGHLAHNGALPWPSVRRPYDAWAEAHAGAEAVP